MQGGMLTLWTSRHCDDADVHLCHWKGDMPRENRKAHQGSVRLQSIRCRRGLQSVRHKHKETHHSNGEVLPMTVFRVHRIDKTQPGPQWDVG